jgi:radical SAM superfamily enzyme YgiQ (UPF0313 family)
MTQLNTPYPATAYLTGFLRERGYDAHQADPAIDLVLKLLCRDGLKLVSSHLHHKFSKLKKVPRSVAHFLEHHDQFESTIDGVIRFLQGRDETFAHRILQFNFLPQGPRFEALDQFDDSEGDPLAWAFGSLGYVDRAKHIASLYVDDVADAIRDGIDPTFELAKYAERLAASAPTFDPILDKLNAPSTLIDQMLDEITDRLMVQHQPDIVGLSVPFPGNVYGAFRIAMKIKERSPQIKTVLGGGYVNTELRQLSDPRVFNYMDYITFDDGEGPLLAIIDGIQAKLSRQSLLRTMVRDGSKVEFLNDPKLHDIPFRDAGTPTYDGLNLRNYLSMVEMLNPMHRMWSNGRWNKLTLAHGCYWKGCNFCDITIDYISRYEEQSAERIVQRIETLIDETGETGFHFVDEAAPPKVMLAMGQKLIERGTHISWWGNVRFEKTFTPKVTQVLAKSGCIAISGGLEVASDRLLKLMNKGVTVEQVARVTRAFADAGILVHAYLMYGFPTQTVQETVDALERVRQLFAEGCIQSAFWHRFVATAHSPVGRSPEKFGVQIIPADKPSNFAVNDLEFFDPTEINHDQFGPGLQKAVYNFMHGIGLEEDVRFWFDFEVPKARVSKNLVRHALGSMKTRDAQ